MCCAQLHNFVINNDGVDITDDNNKNQDINIDNLQTVNGESLSANQFSQNGTMLYLPTMPENDFEHKHNKQSPPPTEVELVTTENDSTAGSNLTSTGTSSRTPAGGTSNKSSKLIAKLRKKYDSNAKI